jgi:hypothetical protein
MKKVLVALLVLGAIILGWFAFKQFAFARWEATLVGPFYGSNYVGRVENAPVSTLNLPSGGSLEINRTKDFDAPLLVLRSASGSNVWSRLLIPEDIASDGSKRRGQIKEIKLQWIRYDRSGFKVYVLCDWNWGGQEAGLVYLKPDLTFEHFSLGW